MEPSLPTVVAAGVVSREGRILVTRRRAGAHLEHRWEFPGGKLEPGESPEECLAREFQEELRVRVKVAGILDVIFYRYPDRHVLLLFYACELADGEPRALGCAAVAWVKREELAGLEWVPADLAFVHRLASGLS